MNTEDLRKTFSKGILSVRGDCVTVKYVFNDTWVTQSFEGKSKDTLKELIRQSKNIAIKIDKKKSVRLIFTGEYGFDHPEFFNELQPEKTLAERRAYIDSLPIVDKYGAFDMLENIDLNDEYALSNVLEELWQRSREDVSSVKDFTSDDLWLRLLGAVNKIPLTGKYIRETEQPEDGLCGCVSFMMESDNFDTAIITEDLIEYAAEVVGVSSTLSIEASVNDGLCNIICFS